MNMWVSGCCACVWRVCKCNGGCNFCGYSVACVVVLCGHVCMRMVCAYTMSDMPVEKACVSDSPVWGSSSHNPCSQLP